MAAFSPEFDNCSFYGRSKKKCGYSSLSENREYVSLKDCNADMRKHLSGCHLSQCLNEFEVILARAGIFRWADSILQSMTICPTHRDEFGKYWRANRSCQYPSHQGKAKAVKDRHVINIEIATQIMDIFGQTVAIGSPICSQCRKDHVSKLSSEAHWTKEHERVEVLQSFDELKERDISSTPQSSLDDDQMSNVTGVLDLSRLSLVTTCAKDPKWTPGAFSPVSASGDSQVNISVDENDVIRTFNEAMATLSDKTSGDLFNPLTFQLSGKLTDAMPSERKMCIEKATEASKIICDVIAPEDGQNIFDSLATHAEEGQVTGDLIALMTAFNEAPSRRLKLQILSLYAYRYPIRQLVKMHEPYGKITEWQIRQARIHAKKHGPGAPMDKKTSHRVRIDQVKLDHFINFINRPQFYQDVAFGMRILKLESGETLEMPNIVRTVTRSTIVDQYVKYCEEEKVSPLSRSTMFRILDVREASQRTSLRGLDNIATDGAVGFTKLQSIVNDLEQLGADKKWVSVTLKRVHDNKLYLKVKYPVHCAARDGSLCKDHCRYYALSDPKDKDFRHTCAHEHVMRCEECEDLKFLINDIEEKVQSQCQQPNLTEKREDMMYDLKQSSHDIFAWKSHIMRSGNQDKAKQDILDKLDDTTVLVVMDWAMKFIPTKFREKQSDWFGKKGLSWHVSSVISKHDGKLEVKSYAHLVDTCNQDWFSVVSILQNLLIKTREEDPRISKAFLRSDEAGCYHNNMLIAASKDISKTTGVTIEGYHFSEPQNGKDICDRLICPLKSAIKTYCNEGNDVISAKDMYTALMTKPVKGVTACTGVIDDSKNDLDIRKLEGFSRYHNFEYERKDLRVWKAYDIGSGKSIPYKSIFNRHLSDSMLLQVVDNQNFFVSRGNRIFDPKKDSSRDEQPDIRLFECPEPGCHKSFELMADLELHLDVGTHQISNAKEHLYDGIRRDWANQFKSISNLKLNSNKPEDLLFGDSSGLHEGWALSETAACVRFTDRVKTYLTAKFDIGERTGNKATPKDVADDMRKARNESGERIFTREEWLKESQIKSFFSRLASSRRLQGNVEPQEIDQEDADGWQENVVEEELAGNVRESIGLKHPIVYDVYDICEYSAKGNLTKLNVKLLKEILCHFELRYSPSERKRELIDRVEGIVKECCCKGK